MCTTDRRTSELLRRAHRMLIYKLAAWSFYVCLPLSGSRLLFLLFPLASLLPLWLFPGETLAQILTQMSFYCTLYSRPMKIGESPLLLDTPWSLSKAQLGLVETRKYYRIEIEARRDVSHYYNRKRKLFHNAQPCGDPSDHERMSTSSSSSSFSEGGGL